MLSKSKGISSILIVPVYLYSSPVIMKNPMNQLLINKLKQDQFFWLTKRIMDYIEKDPYAKTDVQKEFNKNKRKWDYLDLLLDYCFLETDRIDWLDKDLCNLTDNYLKKDNQCRERFLMYLIDWNTIEYCNWKRWFEEWEYDKLIDMLEKTDRPLSVMVVCCRVYSNEIVKWRKHFTANDFISVIDRCKWKQLNVY